MKMKKISVTVIGFLLACCLLVSCGKAGDFRNTNWGDSRNAVEKSEETEYIFAADDIMYFNDTVYEKNTEILYTFADGALNEAQAKFLVMDWILKDIIADYRGMVEQLSEAYGAPLNEDFYIWKTEHPLYEEKKNDAEHNAVYWKVLEFKSEWKTETSYYSLSLNYKDEQINYVLYACPVENATA